MANSVTRNILLKEAKRRNMRVEFIGEHNFLLRLTAPNGQSELLRGTQTARNSAISFLICEYKDLTMDFVQSCGFSVPASVVIENDEALAVMFLTNNSPVVVKPVDAMQAKGVTVGITNVETLHKAIVRAKTYSKKGRVVVQKQLYGNQYRLFVLDGELVAASHRCAPVVIGDAVHTVRQLIEQANADENRASTPDSMLKQIDSSAAQEFLGVDGMDSVPQVDECVRVSDIDSVSRGGQAINVTDHVHASWKRALGNIARRAGLFTAGFDLICEDIAQPLTNNYIPLLEINAMPSLRTHHYPTGGGETIDVASLLLDKLFA